MKVVGQMLQREVAALCSDKVKSVLAQKSKESVKNFRGVVSALLDEMKTRAPTLLSLLKWSMKTRKKRPKTDIVIAMVTSIICKHRKQSACQFQRIVSLILYTGHSSKQVITLYRGE